MMNAPPHTTHATSSVVVSDVHPPHHKYQQVSTDLVTLSNDLILTSATCSRYMGMLFQVSVG